MGNETPTNNQHVEDAIITPQHVATADPLVSPKKDSSRHVLTSETWKPSLKILCTFHVCLNIFICNFYGGGMVPTSVPVAMQFHVDLAQISSLFSYPIMAQGLSNIIWVPLMLKIGKRHTVILNACMLIPCIVWGGCATSYDSLLAARVLGGFALGASESYGPAIIGDLWYEHDLGTVLGVFTACIYISPTIGQILVGYITQGVGWRWGYWLSLIIAVINAIAMILTLPETTYQRHIVVGVTAGDIQRQHKHKDVRTSTHQESQYISDVQPFSLMSNLWYFKHPQVDYNSNYFGNLIRPAIFVIAPNILWSGLLWAAVAGAWVAIGVNIPFLFAGPPYLFSPGSQGLFSLSSLIGIMIGGLAGGYITDKVNDKIEKRRLAANQPHKPEERLIMLIVPAILVPVGLAMYGAVMQRRLHWVAGALAWGINSAGMAMISLVVVSYAVDAYILRSGETMVFLNACRCLVTFGILDVMVNWTLTEGPLVTYGCLAGISGALFVLAVPIFFFGPWLRSKTDRWL